MIWTRLREFNPFSKKSKELISSVGQHGVFRAVRDLFQNTMPWLFFVLGSWHHMLHLRQMYAAVGTESTVKQGEIRRPVNLLPRYQKESYPWSQTWTICAAVHVLQSTWHAEESPQAQKWWLQKHSGQMEQRWQIPQVFVRHWVGWGTDHWKTIPTLLHNKKSEREIMETFFERRSYSKGHWISAVTFSEGEADMPKTVTRIYMNHCKWKPTDPSRATSQKGLINSLNAFEEYDYRLEAPAGWRYYPSSTTHSSSSSRWQPSSDLWPTWSWDSLKSSSWTEQWIFLQLFQWCHFACWKFNHLAIDRGEGRGERGKQHTVHTFFLMRSCCTVILSLTSRTNLTHHAWLKNHGAHCWCFSTKHSHFIEEWHQARALPSSLFLNPSFSEHKPCGDLRPQLSGAWAEPRFLYRIWAQAACWRPVLQALHRRQAAHRSSQDPISTGKLVAWFSSQNRLNRETCSDGEDFPLRHQQVCGSNESFFRFYNPANVARSLLDGNRDHLLAEARSELMKQEHKVESIITLAFVNFSSKLMLSGWNWRMPTSDL